VLSIGEEDSKGNELTLSVAKSLRDSSLNFVGNAEGRDIFTGEFDVIICDGFVGNVVLKFGEAMAKMIFEQLKGEIGKTPLSSLAALAIKPQLTSFKQQVAPDEFGGAPLLGVGGVCLVGHGSSGPVAVKNAIINAARVAEREVNHNIVDAAVDFLPEASEIPT